MNMGFTFWLMLIYCVLTAGMVLALTKRKTAVAAVIAGIMLVGGLVLGFLWVTSPM